MLGNDHRIGNRDGLRSGTLKPAYVPAVMVDRHIADRDQAPGQRLRHCCAGNQRGKNEPGGAVDAAGPRPAARYPVSAVDHFHFWRGYVGNGQEVVRIVPDLLLRLERKKRRHPAKANGQRPTPAGAPAGAAEFETDLRELGGAVLVSAEALRLHDAEYIRIAKRLHGLGRHSFGLL